MRFPSLLAFASTLLASATVGQAADTTVYRDPETGFTFSQYKAMYTLSNSIYYRIAVPSPVSSGADYDVVIQVAAPVNLGWTGLAWGGRMPTNPLTLGWGSGNTVVTSSRWSTGHTAPKPYTGATLQVLRKGTHVNSTYWQYTAKCSGCTSFVSSGRNTIINPTGTSNRLAFVYSPGKPSAPSSNTSDIPAHEVVGYWAHDFAAAANPNFATLVAQNA